MARVRRQAYARDLMGLFDRFRRPALSEPNVGAGWQESEWLTWEAPANVVREGHYQEALVGLCGKACAEGYLIPVEVVLRREPSNPYDPNAIAVFIESVQVGHIAREVAAQIAPAVDRVGCPEWAVCGIIRGGTTRLANLGVHLWPGRRITPGPDIHLRDDTFEARSWPPSKERMAQAVRTLAGP